VPYNPSVHVMLWLAKIAIVQEITVSTTMHPNMIGLLGDTAMPPNTTSVSKH